ncbi:OprO/OprP family phosphate-selective porin [Kushneria indalinina]|uniref:Phosphate-selective porin OprO/OprP n=1 Tax=Kushneria indalinina DSM 14324 TaxID=1122140 RepID=A0A3D9DW37_9GAMM|nr:porin [Kushneria indalinina]REC94990.1 phosphate-selective porin OprO/OprP [Kushneria indalinina DSM 14324]
MRYSTLASWIALAAFTGASAHALAGVVRTPGDQDLIVDAGSGGLDVTTEDERFSFGVHGRVQADYDSFDGIYTDNGKTGDEAEFRRVYLTVKGKAFGDWGYNVTTKLDNSDNDFDNATIFYAGASPATVTFGIFDPDFGLEKATSSKWVTATERNIGYDVAPWINGSDQDLGLQIQSNLADSIYASASLVSRDGLDDVNGKAPKQFNARAVYAPFHTAGNVLHFGIDYAYRDLGDVDFGDNIDTGLGVHGDAGDNDYDPVLTRIAPGTHYGDDSVLGAEFAWASGPFSLQGEYLHRELSGDDAGYDDVKSDGMYGQVAWTLTGESRNYKFDGARFDAIKPENPSLGAWELFYRYGRVSSDSAVIVNDIPSGAVDGENKAYVQTLGVNWYANNSVKVSLNYNHARVDSALENANGDDSGDAIMTRLQYVF